MSAESLVTRVDSMLRPQELLRTALELRKIYTNDKGKQSKLVHYYAVIGDRASEEEFAVLTLEMQSKTFGKDQLVITEVHPIHAETRFRERPPNAFDIMFASGSVLTLEAPESDTQSFLVEMLKEIIDLSKEKGFVRGGTSHGWLAFYEDPKKKDKRVRELQTKSRSSASGASSGDESDMSSGGQLSNQDLAYVKQAGVGRDSVASANSSVGLARPSGAVFDPNMFQSPDVKDIWIAKRMKMEEGEFTEVHKLTVWTGSWNVNEKPPRETLTPWLECPVDDGLPQPDMYALAFQEIDMSKQAVLTNDISKGRPWEEKIDVDLKATASSKFVLLASKQLVGVMMCVFVRQQLLPHISNVETGMAGVGIMNKMGNKGGCAVRFNLYDTSVVFIGSHLAAHMDNVRRRNQDYEEITRRIVFTGEAQRVGGTGARADLLPPGEFGLHDHDHVFWMGDLNYRLPLAHAEIKSKIEEEDWDYLIDYDQLKLQRDAGNVFNGYVEAPLRFPPTYRYDPGTDNYDTSAKTRPPAWCDRVMYRSVAGGVEQLTYNRHNLMMSDHKPVSAMFEVPFRKVLTEKKRETYDRIVRQLGEMEQEFLPEITVASNVLQFGRVKYGAAEEQSLLVENKGQVLVQFKFVPKSNADKVCPKWLTISPQDGVIHPGEACRLTFKVLVDRDNALELNTDDAELEELLVIQVVNGRDVFLSVTGDYCRSCYGNSLDQLVQVPGPVRSTLAAPTHPAVPLRIPKELWRLVDWIFRFGIRTPRLFVTQADPVAAERVRDLLDTGKEIPPTIDPHAVTDALLAFLDALYEPVVPEHLYRSFAEATSFRQAKTLLSNLPQTHYNVLVYVLSFLREVIHFRSCNGCTSTQLGLLFGNVLLRSPLQAAGQPSATSDVGKTTFIFQFLEKTGGDNDLIIAD